MSTGSTEGPRENTSEHLKLTPLLCQRIVDHCHPNQKRLYIVQQHSATVFHTALFAKSRSAYTTTRQRRAFVRHGQAQGPCTRCKVTTTGRMLGSALSALLAKCSAESVHMITVPHIYIYTMREHFQTRAEQFDGEI